MTGEQVKCPPSSFASRTRPQPQSQEPRGTGCKGDKLWNTREIAQVQMDFYMWDTYFYKTITDYLYMSSGEFYVLNLMPFTN